jgi:predicted TIM-barrel fold metal-dependent hydrolase
MILDGHIHTAYAPDISAGECRASLVSHMKEAGVDGGMLLSMDPRGDGARFTAHERLENLMALTDNNPNLYTAYWIDPMADDAAEQVSLAVAAGINSFKIICSRFHPSDERAMATYRVIAKNNKPILFHSGISWDGLSSAKNNRPGEFECLLEIPNLRFTLAHVSWPWYDECIAVYGKFNNAYCWRDDVTCEMFIDVTPGTPPLWREEVFRKLFCGDYDVVHNVIFGTDSYAHKYNASWTKDWMQRDGDLYKKFELASLEDFLECIYSRNLLRFLGISGEKIEKKIPMVGESAENSPKKSL